MTVFGFFPKEDAVRLLPLEPGQATADISVIYVGTRGALGEPTQLATFEVNDGELVQTVIRDERAPAGTQLRSRIVAITPQRELTLQASQASGASASSRSFSWSATCSSALKPNGYFDVAGLICPNVLSGATSLAVDPRGGVHAATAVGGVGGGCGSGRSIVPTYSHFEGGCEPSLSPLPPFRSSGMAVDETTVHFAYLSQSSYEVFYRSRPLNARLEWTEEPVAGQGNPVYEMRVLLWNGQPLILVNRTSGEVELYRRNAGTWSLVPLPALMTGEPLSAQMVDGTLDAEGNLVLLVESYQKVFYQRPGGFELISLPKRGVMSGFGGGVMVDSRGRVHVAYVYDLIGSNADGTGGFVISGRGIYGVYDGTEWTSYELGPITYPRIVTRGEGPLRVVHGLYKGGQVPLALTEVAADGSLRSELITLDPNPSGGTSPDPFVHPTAAVGREGTIAAAWDGKRLYIRPRDEPLAQERTAITFSFEGAGRGRMRSADGTIDCTSTCTVELLVGSRHQLFFEPDSRSVLEQYPGLEPFKSLYGYVWYDVFAGQQSPARIRFRETPVAAVLSIMSPEGSLPVTRLAAREGRLAIVTTTNGQLSFGDGMVTVAPGEALAVRETDGQAWAAPLPTTPAAIGLRSNGAASALFYASSPLSFPGGTVGSDAAPVVVLAHHANGSFQGLERLAEVPSGTHMLAAAVGDDDSAAMVLSNVSGFGSLGVPEFNLLVYRSATGSVVLRGLEAEAAVGGTAGLSLANGRAAVALPNAFNDGALWGISLFQDGAPTGTQRVRGAVLTAQALGPDRLLSLWHPTEGFVDIGAGIVPSNGQAFFLAEHGLDGRPLTVAPLEGVELRANHFALTSTASAIIFVRPNPNFGLEYGRVGDPSYLFTYGGDLLGNKATPMMSDTDDSSFWVAVRHQGTVNYDIAQVENTFRTVVLQLRLP